MSTVASLRTKATLEACLAAAGARNRMRAGVLAGIESVLSCELSREEQTKAIRDELAKLPALLADVEAQFQKRGALIDAASYPDEIEG